MFEQSRDLTMVIQQGDSPKAFTLTYFGCFKDFFN